MTVDELPEAGCAALAAVEGVPGPRRQVRLPLQGTLLLLIVFFLHWNILLLLLLVIVRCIINIYEMKKVVKKIFCPLPSL